jgi:hypothetical protein
VASSATDSEANDMKTRPKAIILMRHYLRGLSGVLHRNTLLWFFNSISCINMTVSVKDFRCYYDISGDLSLFESICYL